MQMLFKTLQEIEREWILSLNLSYNAMITLLQIQGTMKIENYRPMYLMNIDAKISVRCLQSNFNDTLKGHTP
jgi:hypothetical protein